MNSHSDLGEMLAHRIGTDRIPEGSKGMDALIRRAQAWLNATFPERQVYIRSDGRVQFFTFGVGLQATMAIVTLAALGWVAFASVNVIFKDRIIAAKDHRYQQMQASYENRVADLQLSYDELNGALVAAQDKFKSSADELQAKQRAIVQLLAKGPSVARPSGNAVPIPINARRRAGGKLGSDSIEAGVPGLSAPGDFDSGSSELTILPQPVAPQPRTSHPTRASLLDATVGKLANAAGALLGLIPRRRHTRATPGTASRSPGFRILAAQTDRVRRLSAEETALLKLADSTVASRVAAVEATLVRIGLSPNKMERGDAVGGPLVPVDGMGIEGVSDPSFTAAYADAAARGQELDRLLAGLRHVPLTTPVHGQSFELTSDFGPRVDPFTRHIAFHSGLDFGGPWGATVAATAPGIVVFAGPRGGYGNMVEIDHGYGIRTRYGHLSSILVRKGARVEKGTPVGRLGSTGRSTGPHVHYEVWLADRVRDPSRFIEAGRHVLQ